MEQGNLTKPMRRRRMGPPLYASPRDRSILLYLWKWKVASTASIHEAINKIESPYSTYKVMEKLAKSGFVKSEFHWFERFHLWCLTEKGFAAIRKGFGEMKEEGFASENQEHDRLVQAFHLGEWSTFQIPIVSLFSEQEMRRLEMNRYPSWVPQAKEHRPDGYTQIRGHKKNWTIAFEVELSSKSAQRYETLLRFYKSTRDIDRVFWLVANDQIRNEILTAKSCIKDDSANYHVFVDLADYEKNGWDAVVTNERSENLFTIRENMQELCGDLYRDLLGTQQGRSGVTVHLDNVKVIGKTRR
jgi:hypothetical protein